MGLWRRLWTHAPFAAGACGERQGAPEQENTSKILESSHPPDTTMSQSAMPKWFLSTSRHGGFPGQLVCYLATLSMCCVFLIYVLNLPWCNWRLFPLVPSLGTWENTHTHTPGTFFQVEESNKVSFQTKEAHFTKRTHKALTQQRLGMATQQMPGT